MIKKILIILAYSVLFTILIITILFLTKNLLLDQFVYSMMKIRGTANYEGEEKGTEVWNIIFEVIVPTVFLLTLVIVTLFNRKKFKS